MGYYGRPALHLQLFQLFPLSAVALRRVAFQIMEPPPKKKSRAERKADRDKNKNDELQKAAEDEKERAAFFEKMQDMLTVD